MADATLKYIQTEIDGLKEDLEALKKGISLRRIGGIPAKTTGEDNIDRINQAISLLEGHANRIKNGERVTRQEVDRDSWPC